MKTLFCELPLGARFEFRGRRYEKLALSLARDEERFGNVFQGETEVFWDESVPAVPSAVTWEGPRRRSRSWSSPGVQREQRLLCHQRE